jgi:hypothetical protein
MKQRTHSFVLLASASLVTSVLLALPQQGAAQSIGLGGGTTTLGLDAGSPEPIFTFKNNTNMEVFDFLLSTNDSDGFDPDFEGPVRVRMPPGGTDLGWTQSAQGGGVEDVKMTAPGGASGLAIGSEFTIEMKFDGVAAGDILRVTPTNRTGHQIQNSNAQSSLNTYRLFNGYEGLDGALDLAYASINGLSVPITNIRFTSPASGIDVVLAESSLPSFFDASSGILSFLSPIQPGSHIDYLLSVDDLEPFSSGDPDPFTVVLARANGIPEPASIFLLLTAFTALWVSKAFDNRSRAW